jgi:Na+-translocating ferredoxin:NAD+ oxidoreductase RnfD subunit
MMCGPGGSSVGNVFTVLIANALNPLIEHFENRHRVVSGEQS